MVCWPAMPPSGGSRSRTAASDSENVSRRERGATGQHLKQHASERPDIGALVDRQASRLLRAHVRGRSEDHAGFRLPALAHGDGISAGDGLRCVIDARRWIERLRQAEIEHLDRAIAADFHIGGFEIPVDHARLVSGFNGFGHLPGKDERLGWRNGPAGNAVGEVGPPTSSMTSARALSAFSTP